MIFFINFEEKNGFKKIYTLNSRYPKKGILFRDITTLIKDKEAFKNCIDQMSKILGKIEYDKIAAIESRGFIFASPLSYNLSKPNILMRKKNKLPAEKYSEDFELEYGKATLEIHKDSIQAKEKVIIVDDLIATGGTAEAAAKLVEKSGGIVSGFIFVINLFDLGGKKLLEKKGYKSFSLLDFPGH